MSIGFKQNNIWHIYDVYEHVLHVVDGVRGDLCLRLAALFHDLGKPFVYKEDEEGVGHFYGHWAKSNEIFMNFVGKYKISPSISDVCSKLIFYHDLNVDKVSLNELIDLVHALKKEGVSLLYELKRSDLLAQNSEFHYLIDEYYKQEAELLALCK